MTTFYRTPDVVIDAHEWHVVVWKHKSKVSMAFRWRPVSARTHRWLSIASWQGPKPLKLWKYFQPYRRHIGIAMGCDVRRKEAIAALGARKAPPTGAMTRNAGSVEPVRPSTYTPRDRSRDTYILPASASHGPR